LRSINRLNRVPRQGLIEARIRAGLTRPQLADRLAFSRSYVFRVEMGEIDPDVERMTAWLVMLGPGAEAALFERHRSLAKWAGYQPSEDTITAAVLQHWRVLGVPGSLVAAIPNKHAFGQPGLTRGLPDLLVLSPTLGDKTGFIEQKRARRGRTSSEQLAIAEIMQKLGVPYALVRGRDEPLEILELWGAVRQSARAA
jgi:transcriptional regulator with XRE-family HTH domain